MADNSARRHDYGTTVTHDEEDAGGEVIPKPSEKDTNGSATNTASGPITAEEITAVLMQNAPITTADLVGKFKARLRCAEDKKAFADILKRISNKRKTASGTCYIILRESSPATFGDEDAEGEVIDTDGGVPPATAAKQKETKEEHVDNIV